MAVKKQSGNPGNKQKPLSPNMIIGSVLVLLVAVGIGMAIKVIRYRSAEQIPVVQAPQEPAEEIPVVRPPRVREIPIVEQQPVEEVAVEPEPAPEPEPAYEEPVQNQQQYGWNNRQANWLNNPQVQDAMQWMNWFGSLTQQEQAQVIQGVRDTFFSLMQRWQSIPPEQVQAERAELEQFFQDWRNLPAEDRQQGIQNFQLQLEQMLRGQ